MKRILIIWALLISVVYAQSKAGFYVVGGKVITVQDTSSRKYLKAVENAGVTPTTNQNFTSNYLVTTQKEIGVWSLMVAQYPVIGGTAATHAVNIVNPSTFGLTYVGGVTHNPNGFNGNGSTGYAATGVIPTTHLPTDVNITFYTRSSQFDVLDCLGAYRNGEPSIRFIIRSSSLTTIASGLTSSTSNDRVDSSPILTKGVFMLNTRPIANWVNGVNRGGTISGYGVAGKSTRQITIGAISEGNAGAQYSNRNFALVSIASQGFTDLQIARNTHIVTFTQSLLGRQ